MRVIHWQNKNTQKGQRYALAFLCLPSLDKLGCLEGFVGTVLGDSAKAFSRNVHNHVLAKFWYIDTSLLQVWLAASLATRVKLRRTRAVRVAAPNLGLFAGDVTLLCHINRYLVATSYHKALNMQAKPRTMEGYGITVYTHCPHTINCSA